MIIFINMLSIINYAINNTYLIINYTYLKVKNTYVYFAALSEWLNDQYLKKYASFSDVPLDAEDFLGSHESKTIDFSLFTPIRRPYYLRAVDASRCHRFSRHPADGLQIAGMQMRFLSCRLLEMLFTPPSADANEKMHPKSAMGSTAWHARYSRHSIAKRCVSSIK